MNKINLLMNTLTRTAGRTGLIAKKYSPEILLITGVAGLIGSTVLACRATLKADEVLDQAKQNIDKIHQAKDFVDSGVTHGYTEQDYKKDMTVVYAQTGWEFVKLYGPAITLGAASIACILGAHGIMRRRNIALVAAYKAVEQGFADYRKRVVEELGEEKDRQFKYGIKQSKVQVTEMGENGEVKTTEENIESVDDPNKIGMYSKFFDEYSVHWSKDPSLNLNFLLTQQNWANDLLNSRGHVFLNEVYDMLNIPRTTAGAIVGWVKGNGDGYIDFGIYNGGDKMKRFFVNGHETSILLDFNVDGVIYDMI